MIYSDRYEHGLHTYNFKTNVIKDYVQIPDSQGIIMNSVYCITEDSLGNLSFGTNKGPVRYNPETGQYKNYEANKKVNINSLSSNAVIQFAIVQNTYFGLGLLQDYANTFKTKTILLFTLKKMDCPIILYILFLKTNLAIFRSTTNRGPGTI